MDLALNNLQRLICHKTNKPNKPNLFRQLVKEKKNSEFKPALLHLKVNLVSHRIRSEGVVYHILPVANGLGICTYTICLHRQKRTRNLLNIILTSRFNLTCVRKYDGRLSQSLIYLLKRNSFVPYSQMHTKYR